MPLKNQGLKVRTMGVSINLKSTNQTAQNIYELWENVGRLEPSPSMSRLNYPPHFTFAIYDDISVNQVIDVLSQVAKDLRQIEISFSEIRNFDANPKVVWIAPEDARELIKIHVDIHARIDPSLSRPYYRPNAWFPHCTLGTNVPQETQSRALSILEDSSESLSVTFDIIDCVQFPPISVAREYPLAR
jgi:2'-5' RNA ligase